MICTSSNLPSTITGLEHQPLVHKISHIVLEYLTSNKNEPLTLQFKYKIIELITSGLEYDSLHVRLLHFLAKATLLAEA